MKDLRLYGENNLKELPSTQAGSIPRTSACSPVLSALSIGVPSYLSIVKSKSCSKAPVYGQAFKKEDLNFTACIEKVGEEESP